ncbi:hypothetical protein OSB04_018674 [Centaurea solstitialis]|uniref:non-specific serine/threonine protein kinase n=1 Tax=Centaurea solstitialis TaxID=347529 RepID=A0AA38WLZ1_9ASTR|nr:hypothetical protein OSB04_018674 [Centaurea solstitialis]
MGAAQGLAFLHTAENSVIFRDIKSSNILLDGASERTNHIKLLTLEKVIYDFNAKLSDFGLVKSGLVNGESHVSTVVVGTYGYAAPEYMSTGRLYVKSDLYGFGVLMLEIITGLRAGSMRNLVEFAKPFLSDIKRLQRIMDPRFDQDYPSRGASKAVELILSCLESIPENRPSMEEVISGLRAIGAMKMKPRRSNTKTKHLIKEPWSSNWHQENHHCLQSITARRMYFSTGLIFLLTVLDIVVYYLQKQQEEDDAEQKSSSPSLDKQCRRFSLAEIKLATRDFDDEFVIGKGGFGNVYKGTMDFGGDIVVAIKRLNIDSDQGATEFCAEIEMLSKFRHSHIVSLLGYHESTRKREMILVYEYLSNGSLEDHLHKRRAHDGNFSPLTWVQRLRICIDAARGLDYLHTGTGVRCRVLHRDVKSSNILLDENWAGKIADFGLSRTGPAYRSCTTNVYTKQIRGTFGYMDAHYFATHRLTRKSDVYAFGVVLFEVLCGRPALDFTLDEKQYSLASWAKYCVEEGTIHQSIDPCLRGEVSTRCRKEFSQIAYKCLLWDPKDRPTMAEVVVQLEFVLQLALRKYSTVTFVEKARSLLTMKFPVPSNPKKKAITKEEQPTTVMVEGGSDHGDNTKSQESLPFEARIVTPNLKRYTFAELRRAAKNFKTTTALGEGGFGQVFKGWVDGVTYAPSEAGVGIPVAIKKLHAGSLQGLEEWQTEVDFLGKLNHPNLIKLLGYCREDRELLLVYEYMQKGSLDNHLFRKGVEPLPWDTRIKIAMGAAQGLAFLHTAENNVIWRDVKSSNDFNAKLSDFGLTKSGPVDGASHVSTRVAGTYGYAAPEYVATGHLQATSDIYGFGVLMLEIITGLRAYDCNRPASKHYLVQWGRPFLSDRKSLQRIMDPRLDQAYPSKGARKAAKLILSCLESIPKNRPSMEEVASGLRAIGAMKMKPRQSNTNTKNLIKEQRSSKWHQQYHHWSVLGSKFCRKIWSTGTRPLRALIGSKQERTGTKTNRTKKRGI